MKISIFYQKTGLKEPGNEKTGPTRLSPGTPNNPVEVF
jgi:hypothetical protein